MNKNAVLLTAVVFFAMSVTPVWATGHLPVNGMYDKPTKILNLDPFPFGNKNFSIDLMLTGGNPATFTFMGSSPSTKPQVWMSPNALDPATGAVEVNGIVVNDLIFGGRMASVPRSSPPAFELRDTHRQYRLGTANYNVEVDLLCDDSVDRTEQMTLFQDHSYAFAGFNGNYTIDRGTINIPIDTPGGTIPWINSIGSSGMDGVIHATPPICTHARPTSTTLPLQGGRFVADVVWRDVAGAVPDPAVAMPPFTDNAGVFWFFDDNNFEMLVKVLDGCADNNHFWVFAAGGTSVDYFLTVTDTQASQSKSYFNDLGNPAPAVTDTTAFATCP